MIFTKDLRKIYEIIFMKISWNYFSQKKLQESLDMPLHKKSVVVVIFRDVKNENLEEGKKLRTPSFMYIGVKSPGDWCIFPIDQTIIISKTNLTHGPQWIRKIQNKPKKLMKWNGINFTKNYFSFKIFPLILPDFNHYGKYSKKKI